MEARNAEQLASRLQAEEYLANKGYTKIRCDRCYGSGIAGQSQFRHGFRCPVCNGDGWIWKAPISK